MMSYDEREESEVKADPTTGGLVERMLDADFEARAAGKWQNCDPMTQKRFLEGMSAALKVAGEEMLSDPTSVEAKQMEADFEDGFNLLEIKRGWQAYRYSLRKLLSRRRDQILSSPKPPTLAERIRPILDKWYNHPCDTQALAEEVVREMEKRK